MENNNQIFLRISFTWKDYRKRTNQILIPYDESLRDDISQIKDFYAKEWIIFIKNDRSKWMHHRSENDGPAVEKASGDKFYYLNGKLHRENGPAFEDADGYKCYYLNNLRHRENGPAIEWADGDKEYWLNGKRHRENGPAVEQVNGDKEYWLNNKYFKSKSEYLKALRELHGK